MPVQPPVVPVLSRIQSISARFDVAPARAAAMSTSGAAQFSNLLNDSIAVDAVPGDDAATDPLGSPAADLPVSADAQMALHRAGLCTCDRPASTETAGGPAGVPDLAMGQVASVTGGIGAGGAAVSATSVMGLSSRAGWSGAAPYEAAFTAAGAKHGVDPRLLASVARAESNFRPDAKSPAGALGLMQFMPATARSMGVNPLDPDSAIDGAARYLRQQMDRFGSVELALAAYNAGPGAVSRFGGVPPYSETRNYVTKVLGSFRALG